MVSGASMGCSCQGFRLVSACRGMVLGTAPSGFLDRVPFQRLKGPLWPFGGGYAWALSSPGVETGASGGLPAARCTSNAFLCAISARCGNQQKKRYAFMDLFHLGWRDSLSIKNPAFWCISMSAPPAFIGSSNAALEWQARVFWWQGRKLMAACPLQGFVRRFFCYRRRVLLSHHRLVLTLGPA